ncbi:acetate--CoA ligase [Stackebrandtia nassauensis]|uniref:acetate--CoA ligase n=1 Tax=Stackebrandtia nassauensis (strain DSM 44728 / CIP 108903 / NRRL B-16338 / NBRC 102104 / LLR-40K-21) TaxID=446470 RepID=D3PVL5_STANL|nr:acetate--CoA ligase [Stackebrandtia nassauensis]ADD43129.1 AMP-dependent synthetase and ligase [Stackebrandtia nassauensis DSM 44728]
MKPPAEDRELHGHPPIHKTREFAVSPNLQSYPDTYKSFDWDVARDWLSGLPGGRGLNIAHEAVDRHADGPLADKLAIRCVDRTGAVTDINYTELKAATGRFANVLRRLGVGSGDRVFSLLGRIPELYVTALGTLKNTSVFSPLFPAFGPEPIHDRLVLGDARVLVTSTELYTRKIARIRDRIPSLEHVLVVGEPVEGTEDLEQLMFEVDEDFEIPDTDPESMALLHFTSGTTGKPKGAVHVHEALLAHYASARYALDLHPDDVFWCTADPGWVTGTSYGIIAPLAHGATLLTDAAEFDAKRWYRMLADNRVSVWYTAPTAIRMLMRQNPELAARHDLSALRFVASVGEPLNPEAVVWGQRVLGLPIHDNWWQTETGAIMISNYVAMDIRPGSMGRPLPGVEAGLLRRGEDGRALVTDGRVEVPTEADQIGELALRTGWPSMFRGYLHEPRRYEHCFADGWYLSGDVARRDADGYYWFVARADDVIKSAGHLIGPFEVESVLMEHPAVAEAGVIGKPDPVAGNLVKAFVSLRPGVEPDDQLRLDVMGFARKRLGGLAPKEITFQANLPHTRSGKVMRRLLKARELGLAEGDLSTLEGSS